LNSNSPDCEGPVGVDIRCAPRPGPRRARRTGRLSGQAGGKI